MLGMYSLLSPPSYSQWIPCAFHPGHVPIKKALGHRGSKASIVDNPIENP